MTAEHSPAVGGYVMVFSGLDTDELGLAGSPYRERFRTVATPEAFEHLGSGALSCDVPDTIALVELITPDGLRIDSRLVLMTDEQNRGEAVDAIRYAIDNDPGPVPAEP